MLTLEITKQIKQKYDVPSLAHLTCVSSTKETVKDMIDKKETWSDLGSQKDFSHKIDVFSQEIC